MSVVSYLEAMPKVELHVHLEGSIRPETLLKLAHKHGVRLPATTLEGVQAWYSFRDFDHFIEIYFAISDCIRTVEDIELIVQDFARNQAAQNVRYSEVTYTAYTHFMKGLSFADQLAALNRGRAWGRQQFGVEMNFVIDISRNMPPEDSLVVADWVIAGQGDGVVALGLGGPEVGYPPELFTAAFERVRAAGVPAVPHAGETAGAASMWGALRSLHACRLGHGVRCLEDAALVDELRRRQVPLEVCLTSNVCLHVAQDWESHPLPALLEAGLLVTVNSDDPPMFNTTLNQEYVQLHTRLGLGVGQIEQLALNAAQSALLPAAEKAHLLAEMQAGFVQMRAAHGVN